VSLQKGYRIHAWGQEPVWEEFPVPDLGEGEVLVEVEACGVGLTVLNSIRGDLADERASLPRVPGHELTGRVVELGAGAPRELLGRRVVAYFYLSCGTCPECLAGRESRCRRLAGWVGVHRDGGYAPYAALPAFNVLPVPEEMDPVAATTLPDAIATPVHVCRLRARVSPEDRVAVIGAGGGVGIHMIQVARVHGAEVAGLDVSDAKLAAIEELGALPVRSEDFAGLDPESIWPRKRPTVVVDLIGTHESLAWSSEALDSGGRMIVLTTFRERSFPADPRRLVFREAAILGSRYASRAEVGFAAHLVASGRVRPVVGGVVGPEGIPALHSQLRRGELVGRGALVWK
jgi:D-arabinose 1-dehydrogenase-like Zn-dependent alcohol dehydrogenase